MVRQCTEQTPVKSVNYIWYDISQVYPVNIYFISSLGISDENTGQFPVSKHMFSIHDDVLFIICSFHHFWIKKIAIRKFGLLKYPGILSLTNNHYSQTFCCRYSLSTGWPISTPLKNISQLGCLFPIDGKIIQMFQTTNQFHVIILYDYSMDWFKGKMIGNPRISWKNRWFPAYFPASPLNYAIASPFICVVSPITNHPHTQHLGGGMFTPVMVAFLLGCPNYIIYIIIYILCIYIYNYIYISLSMNLSNLV